MPKLTSRGKALLVFALMVAGALLGHWWPYVVVAG